MLKFLPSFEIHVVALIPVSLTRVSIFIHYSYYLTDLWGIDQLGSKLGAVLG